MGTVQNLAKNYRAIYFGKSWTASNIKDQLEDVTWQEAIKEIYGLNTIAILLNHLHYYTRVATKVLEGGPLEGSDKLSFAHEVISSESDWKEFKNRRFEEAELFAGLLEKLEEETLWQNFGDKNYGHYYRNLQGTIEHAHYHLGQIVYLKKIIRQQKA